ncbi:hypothetical protein [Mycoplasma sp. Ms02]|uniref:hypothetical protein n=1 Tax=Mycoplasma sp. Ms02 TaxID=353851 RepID=UPI001C8A01B6|nr:hypothetical protein [Mycoplasma sp. Ms02]QZE12640.1 hypothetical protein K4L35_01485 [Mycoplasma sp. Ms02]
MTRLKVHLSKMWKYYPSYYGLVFSIISFVTLFTLSVVLKESRIAHAIHFSALVTCLLVLLVIVIKKIITLKKDNYGKLIAEDRQRVKKVTQTNKKQESVAEKHARETYEKKLAQRKAFQKANETDAMFYILFLVYACAAAVFAFL